MSIPIVPVSPTPLYLMAALGRFFDLKNFFLKRLRLRRLLVNSFRMSVTLPSFKRARMMTPVELEKVSIQYKMLKSRVVMKSSWGGKGSTDTHTHTQAQRHVRTHTKAHRYRQAPLHTHSQTRTHKHTPQPHRPTDTHTDSSHPTHSPHSTHRQLRPPPSHTDKQAHKYTYIYTNTHPTNQLKGSKMRFRILPRRWSMRVLCLGMLKSSMESLELNSRAFGRVVSSVQNNR